MNITSFGTGYVGLLTGSFMTEVGNDFICMDVNQQSKTIGYEAAPNPECLKESATLTDFMKPSSITWVRITQEPQNYLKPYTPLSTETMSALSPWI